MPSSPGYARSRRSSECSPPQTSTDPVADRRRTTRCQPAGRLFRRQLYILVRGRVGVARNQPEAGLGHAGAVPVEEAQLPDRREHGLVVHELLELVEDRLAALGVQLGRLLAEEAFDVRVTAIAVEAELDPKRRETILHKLQQLM